MYQDNISNYIIGLDIGGTKTAVILGALNDVGSKPDIIKRTAFATNPADPKPTLKRIYTEIEEIFKICGQNRPTSIGVSCGGPLDSRKGLILSPPNLWGWDKTPITALLKAEFKIPAFLQNDANAGAAAEWKYGAGRGCDNMIFLTCGTGFGAGLILNGKLYSGANNMAGEIGHVRLADNGPVGYGKSGSCEGFCSGGGLAQLGKIRITEQLQIGNPPSFCKTYDELNNITAKTLADAANAGDKLALDIYKEFGYWLGKSLAILIDLLNPDKIVIGSIFARCEKLLRQSMENVLKKECLPYSLSAVQIVPAELGEAIGDLASLAVASGI